MKMTWTNDLQLVKMVQKHEGLKLKPYHCTEGYLTIGYGRNLEAKGITEVEAHLLLLNDLKEICAELDVILPWWRNLDMNAQRVLIDMSMMGTQKILKFEKMLAAMRAGHYQHAASELINSKYAKQTKTRATDLWDLLRAIPNKRL